MFDISPHGHEYLWEIENMPWRVQYLLYPERVFSMIQKYAPDTREERVVSQQIDLNRFTEAHRSTYSYALREIQNGYKMSHWMWFIFPQIKGLGRSSTSQYYAIESLEEAKAFLKDPYLGGNLVEISKALLALQKDDPVKVFGSVDAMKLKSCMTLFECAGGDEPVFGQVLEKYFGGRRDRRTLRILGIPEDKSPAGEKEENAGDRDEGDRRNLRRVVISCRDDNIDALRERYPEGLHFAVGDTHGEVETLKALLEKIRFDPRKDHLYFVGDYNAGGNPNALLAYLSGFYQEDCALPGCHLIRGNHERELGPTYPLENLPDAMVLRGRQMNYYLVHAGMVRPAFALINKDMADHPDEKYFAYALDESCAGFNAPLRQLTWSMRGLYSQHSRWHPWPFEEDLHQHKACIIHGHSPYCFFMGNPRFGYGDENIYWDNQHVWFSQDLQSFNIDANVKGRYENSETYRGLACLCLEVVEEIAARQGGRLTIEGIQEADNAIFGVPLVYSPYYWANEDLSRILNARPKMKRITLGADNQPEIREF